MRKKKYLSVEPLKCCDVAFRDNERTAFTDERQQPDSLAEANTRHRKRSIRSKQRSGSPICDHFFAGLGSHEYISKKVCAMWLSIVQQSHYTQNTSKSLATVFAVHNSSIRASQSAGAVCSLLTNSA